MGAASVDAPGATGVPVEVEAVVVEVVGADPDEWAAGWRRS